jgi:GT2 family glycosyltransferase
MIMRTTAVVATYNRAALLDDCLTHLARQRFEPGDELIVVDNGSTDDTAAVIARHRQTCAVPLLHLNEPRPGKTHALAKALAVASGDVLAFTDDDVNVEDSWLDAIRTAMRDPAVALVGGPVVPRWERPLPRWLVLDRNGYGRLSAPLAIVDYGRTAAELGDRTFLGANMAARREVFERVGGFAPHLGKRRGTLLSGEDHEFCRRVQAAGFRAQYCPDARVRHWVPASRMRLRYFLDWFFWSGITNAALDEGMPRPRRGTIFGLPRYLVRRFVEAVVGLPLYALLIRRTAALNAAIDAAFVIGYAAGRWRLVHAGATDAPVPAGDAV